MSLQGRIVDYLDGKTPEFALVLVDNGSALQAMSETGKRLKVKPRRVWVEHDVAATPESVGSAIGSLRAEVEALRAEIDLELLWESVGDDAAPQPIGTLCELYFGEAPPPARSAMLRALVDDGLYFTRKGDDFAPRPGEHVEATRLAERRQAERERERADLRGWLAHVLEQEDGIDVPEERREVLHELELFLLNGKASDASAVLSDIDASRPPREVAFDVLSRAEWIDPEGDGMLLLAGIRLTFPDEVLAEAEAVTLPDLGDRAPVEAVSFSIDDASTRDIDDALSWEPLPGGGGRVGIHIADVPALVDPGSALDAEARRRGLSVYSPTHTIPMFPEALSAGLASLVEREPRAALSFYARFDEHLQLIGSEVVPTRVEVDHRLTYDAVDASLAGEAPLPVHDALVALDALSAALQRQRLERGALILDQPEVYVHVHGEDIRVTSVDPDSAARRIVSELMILANGLAGAYAAEHEIPVIYRVQDAPDNPDLVGRQIPYDPVEISTLIRGLRRSRFTTHPAPHAALGLEAYTQVTSPIRRYADLVLQRQLIAHAAGRPLPYSSDDVMRALATAEEAQREARGLQRKATRYWLLKHLDRDRRDDVLDAVVVQRHAGGALCEIAGLGVRGLVPGEAGLDVGQRVRVRIVRARPQRESLTLALDES